MSNGTNQDNGDLLVSYYALYPNGTRGNQRLSVPLSVLLSAITDGLSAIAAATAETITIGGMLNEKMPLAVASPGRELGGTVIIPFDTIFNPLKNEFGGT